MKRSRGGDWWWGFWGIVIGCVPAPLSAEDAQGWLSPHNPTVPFCYLHGDRRSWPIFVQKLPAGSRVSLVAREGGKELAAGEELRFSGLSVALSNRQELQIISQTGAEPISFKLEVSLTLPNGASETQQLSVRSAPPPRPISYLSDFGDDLIRMFMDSRGGQWQTITKSSFDQHFRRCQAHGVDRVVMWQSPFPYICDPANYAAEDWDRYEKQARAMVQSDILESLVTGLKQRALEDPNFGLHVPWGWVRQLCKLRLQRDLGEMISQSAEQHGISLTASFRPFETALTKYYEIPAFDHEGNYLWGFLPLATPVVNSHPEATCFAHYRTLLQEMNQAAAGQLATIEIAGVENAKSFVERFSNERDNLQIVASGHAPLQEDSLVLHRAPGGEFQLRPFDEIKGRVEDRQKVLQGFQVEREGDLIRITGLQLPDHLRYLILSNSSSSNAAIDLAAIDPVRLVARAGNRLGRGNLFWVLDKTLDPEGLTKVAGIPTTGRDHTEFHATENSQKLLLNGPPRLPLKGHQLVIDLGAPWSVEMMDLNRSAMRANVAKEMKTLLDLPAFDELFINTRSHVSLAASMADGAAGLQPLAEYRRSGKKIHAWLGIDRAYAPLSAAEDSVLRSWAADRQSIERLTTWQANEWNDFCQTENSPFRWRYVRNREVARGVRRLLEDLEQTFPGVRTRIVLPLREKAVLATKGELEAMPDANGNVYGRDYSRVWSTINHIRSIGEGMALVDLSGLATEPVFFGVRGLPDARPLASFLRHSISDLAENRGSAFRGPRSFFFEAQESLRAQDRQQADARRQEIICEVLSYANEIDEVLLYESADWLYFLPLSNPAVCGHAYLDRCGKEVLPASKPDSGDQDQ